MTEPSPEAPFSSSLFLPHVKIHPNTVLEANLHFDVGVFILGLSKGQADEEWLFRKCSLFSEGRLELQVKSQG